jgi:FixJ family two-component response regulator
MNPEIILVDDDEVLLVILEKMFLKVKPDVNLKIFSSGRDALEYLTTTSVKGKKHFLLVDIYLKDLSGWDFLNELTNRKDEEFKVFLFTSSVSSVNHETAKKYPPVVDFFEKPISFEKIHRILELIQQE